MAVLKAVIIGSQRKAEIFQHLLASFPEFEFSGYYDPDDEANTSMTGELLFTYELCDMGDVFIFDRHTKNVLPTVLETLLKMGKHVLFDGYLTQDIGLAEKLMQIQHEAQTCFQISNVLYNKPLFTTARQFIRKPRFIKIEKNCNSPKAGEFEKWLFFNLSQEMDIVLRLVESGIRRISAKPLFLFGNSPDLLNIHIEFDNDSVCHISLGRAIENGLHKLRVFQQDKLFHLDFSDNSLIELRPVNPADQLSILQETDTHGVHEFIEINRPVMPFDSWKMELRNFHENIHKNLTPATHLEHMEYVSSVMADIVDKVQRKYAEV